MRVIWCSKSTQKNIYYVQIIKLVSSISKVQIYKMYHPESAPPKANDVDYQNN